MVVMDARRVVSKAPDRAAVVSGVAGALLALAQLVVPPMVPRDQFSAPFTPALFTLCATLLFLIHLAVVPLTVAIARSAGSRLAAVGGAIASIGTVALAIAELVSILAAHERGATPIASTAESGYGPGTILVAVGMLLLGVAAIRARRPGGGLVLVIGVFTLVPLIPAVAAGPPFAMLALCVWSLLYGALGIARLRR